MAGPLGNHLECVLQKNLAWAGGGEGDETMALYGIETMEDAINYFIKKTQVPFTCNINRAASIEGCQHRVQNL